ncbi:MAG TPA: hypothetical protein VJ583_03500 [Nitrososphaeraceae archaeon]|nr:hypothetical protein [Nitrososphaeraceae archaeon]
MVVSCKQLLKGENMTKGNFTKRNKKENFSDILVKLSGQTVELIVKGSHSTSGILANIEILGKIYFFLIHPFYPTKFDCIFDTELVDRVSVEERVTISINGTISEFKEEKEDA